MKKSILVLLAFLLAPLMASAQTPVEREIQQLGFKSVGFKISSSVTKRSAATAPASADLFKVEMPETNLMFLPTLDLDSDVTVDGFIKNLSGAPLAMGFIREQTLPKHWGSSVCFGQNCYAEFVSAKVAEEPWKADERREFILHVRTPPGAEGTANIVLTLYSPASSDSVDITFTITALPVPDGECRTFLIDNPYAGDVTFKQLGIDHPELFDVTITSDTEYPTYEGGIFRIQLCSKMTDGQEHSTVISIETDSGTVEQTVTLRAPGGATVKPLESASGIRIASISPNPAVGASEVSVNLESTRAANVTLAIVDLLGREIRSVNTLTNSGAWSMKLDASELAVGSYIVLMKEQGQVIDQASFNVTR